MDFVVKTGPTTYNYVVKHIIQELRESNEEMINENHELLVEDDEFEENSEDD